MTELDPRAAGERLKAFAHPTRLMILVDYAQDGTLRCYYLCQPRFVEDMLTLVGRKENVVKRSVKEIQADKDRLAPLQPRPHDDSGRDRRSA